MKKFLSLVLALAMTMSLVTISAGAKDFTDADKITYVEAVEVMTAIGVVDGDTAGNFNPTNGLTRGAAAKIICNLILGPTTAAALNADANPYKDVDKNSTFAGYIAFCQKEGIISGYADGTFRPAAPLTGYAFMKMLLGALGYDVEVEGYTGANWSINVAKRALNIGLDDGLVGEFNGSAYVTREEAMLYAFNALQATMVEYDSKTTVSVGGADVVIAGSKATEVEYKNGKYDGNIEDDNLLQFAEKYFTNLKAVPDRDDFYRPATTWKIKVDTIGTYTDTPDLTYTAKVENGDIYKDLGLANTIEADDVDVYEDGLLLNHVVLKKGEETQVGNSDNGVLTEVYYYDSDDTVEIITINSWVGEINKTVQATAKKDAYIVIDTESVKPVSSGTVTFETDETFEDDAFVVYTYSKSAKEVKSVELATAVSGEVTRAVNESVDTDVRKSVTIDGTVYKASANIDGVQIGEISVNNDYDVYLDGYGYMIYIEETEALSGNYALVLATNDKSNFSSNKALLLFTDGTEKIVDTAKNYKAAGTNNIPNGTIVTFKEDDGVYTLKPVKTTLSNEVMTTAVGAFGTADATFKMDNDKAGVTLTTGSMYAYAKNGSNVMAQSDSTTKTVTTNSNTVFVVYDNGDDEYTAYTGIKNAPSIDATSSDVEVYAYCKSGVMATVMFVFVKDSSAIEDDSNNTLFLAKESASDLIHDSYGDYFEYSAYVNGELKTVKVDSALGKSLNGMYKTYSVDKYGVITKVSVDGTSSHGYTAYTTGLNKEYYADTGIDKTSADYTVTLNGTVITVADDAVIYAVNEDGKITESSYRSISKDANDKFYAIVEDYLVKVLFIEEVEDVELSNNTTATFTVKGLPVVDGKVTVTTTAAKDATTAYLAVAKIATGASVTKVEWSVDGSTWNNFVSYNNKSDISSDSNLTSGNLKIRVTVTAEDGVTTEQYVIAVAYQLTHTVTVSVGPSGSSDKAIVTVNSTVYTDCDELTVNDNATISFTVTPADGYKVSTVEVGGTAVTGFGGVYTTTVSSDVIIAVTTAALS